MAIHLQGTEPVVPTPAQPHAGSFQKAGPRHLSLSLLIALVIGSMIGNGIFSASTRMDDPQGHAYRGASQRVNNRGQNRAIGALYRPGYRRLPA